MADPVTIGGLVASALAMTAETVLKGAVGEAIKDAYKGLKEKLLPSAAAEIAALENDPNSKGRQIVVAEIVDRQAEDERNALRALAEALIDELKAASRIAPIGVDIGELEAKRVNLPPLTVVEGIGFRAGKVKVDGEFTGQQVIVGKE